MEVIFNGKRSYCNNEERMKKTLSAAKVEFGFRVGRQLAALLDKVMVRNIMVHLLCELEW